MITLFPGDINGRSLWHQINPKQCLYLDARHLETFAHPSNVIWQSNQYKHGNPHSWCADRYSFNHHQSHSRIREYSSKKLACKWLILLYLTAKDAQYFASLKSALRRPLNFALLDAVQNRFQLVKDFRKWPAHTYSVPPASGSYSWSVRDFCSLRALEK